MKIVQFRYLNTDDECELKYKWCSRVYEYPTVLKFIDSVKFDDIKIHNTSAGYAQDLGFFMKEFIHDLNNKYGSVVHSDRLPTADWNIEKFDLITDVHDRQYDVVLNISVIEHLPAHQQIDALYSLWSIVKIGGYLVLTFDLPAVNLSTIEDWCGGKCETKPDNAVNGLNSKFSQPQYSNYNFILLILQKDE
jgi:hypothetical protein